MREVGYFISVLSNQGLDRTKGHVAHGNDDDNAPTRASSRSGVKVSYIESDEEFEEADSKLVDSVAEVNNTKKVLSLSSSLLVLTPSSQVDQVLDHALYVSGTSVTFDDFTAMKIVDKKKCLLSSTDLQETPPAHGIITLLSAFKSIDFNEPNQDTEAKLEEVKEEVKMEVEGEQQVPVEQVGKVEQEAEEEEDNEKDGQNETLAPEEMLSEEEEKLLSSSFPKVRYKDNMGVPTVTKYKIKWEGKVSYRSFASNT